MDGAVGGAPLNAAHSLGAGFALAILARIASKRSLSSSHSG
jgi:hypothetical protein